MSDTIRFRPTEGHCRRFYVEALCGMYQIAAYPPIRVSDREIDGGFLAISHLDSCCRDIHSWRARLRRAWRVLWSCPDTEVFFEDAADLDRVCAALQDAASVAFPQEDLI